MDAAEVCVVTQERIDVCFLVLFSSRCKEHGLCWPAPKQGRDTRTCFPCLLLCGVHIQGPFIRLQDEISTTLLQQTLLLAPSERHHKPKLQAEGKSAPRILAKHDLVCLAETKALLSPQRVSRRVPASSQEGWDIC